MTQVHPVTGLADGKQHFFVELAAGPDLPEQQDPADGHERNAEGVVEPRSLPQGGQAHGALYREYAAAIGPDPAEEAHGAHGESRQEHGQRDAQRLLPGQLTHEFAEIQSQQQIAHETAQVIKHPVGVPAGFAPKGILGRIRDARGAVNDRRRAARPLPDEGDERRKQPDEKVHLQFPFPYFLRPGRQQRHNQVQAHQHVHEPQMPRRVIEIEQQVLEVLHRLAPDERIDDGPHSEGNQDPRRPPAEELARGIVQRELQITGRHDK